MKYWQI